jgi:hypothetical protein
LRPALSIKVLSVAVHHLVTFTNHVTALFSPVGPREYEVHHCRSVVVAHDFKFEAN